MKRVLQIFAIVLALAATITWAATGASRGWTKTEVAIKTLDPVTEIEGIGYEDKFQPGVDFLFAAFGGTAFLFGASIFFRKTKTI